MRRKIRHVANIRNIGGLTGADGRIVAYGRLIRGGHLHRLNAKDADKFREKLGVTQIIDLRSPSELEEKPDVIPEGVEYSYFPSLTNEQNPAINRHNRRSELKRISHSEGGAMTYLSNIYRLLITQDLSRKAHRAFLLKLLEIDDGAVYLHCTQGKDRTGVAAAVILMTLGVSREDILREYMSERKMLVIRNFFLTKLVGVLMLSRNAGKSLSVLMNAKRQCLEAAFDEIDKVYGSCDNYIRDGLGITDEQITTLRSKYLV